MLDAGVSEKFSESYPNVILQNFTDENTYFTSHDHGTFSLSVY